MADAIAWVKGYNARGEGPMPGTYSARYSLRALVEKGLLRSEEGNGLLMDADLLDFSWSLTWTDDTATLDDRLAERIGDVDGYVLFIHGWTGNQKIWEELPGMVVTQNRRLVAIAVDHNGFGETPFADRTPEFHECNPAGAMLVIEHWFDLLNLRRQPGDPRPKTINFVGHSMGGAALFFLNEARYRMGEQTRLAIAPALLLEDEGRRAFYTTLGLGIGLVGRLQFLEVIDRVVSPRVIDILCEGATEAVKEEHTRVYAATPKSVTARTFAAMGVIHDYPQAHAWDLMHVILGHKDLLVGVIPMMELLQQLQFKVGQVHVVMGTHYLFSLGEEMKTVHEQNRTLVLEMILDLHNRALEKQRHG